MGDSPKKNGQDQHARSQVQVADSVGLKDSFTITARKDGLVVGQRTSDEDGRQSGVNFDDAGGVTVIAAGTPRRGEEGGKAAVQRLAHHLAEQGQFERPWKVVTQEEDPVGISGDVDCEVRTSPASGSYKVLLRAQVTRAAGSHTLVNLGRSGRHVGATSTTELADLMRDSIAKKVKHYGGQNRINGLVLVLDAMDHQSSVATPPVIEAFQTRHGAFARTCGFDAIWLVGPMKVFPLSG